MMLLHPSIAIISTCFLSSILAAVDLKCTEVKGKDKVINIEPVFANPLSVVLKTSKDDDDNKENEFFDEDSLVFNLCKKIEGSSDVLKDKENCKDSGICFTRINYKKDRSDLRKTVTKIISPFPVKPDVVTPLGDGSITINVPSTVKTFAKVFNFLITCKSDANSTTTELTSTSENGTLYYITITTPACKDLANGSTADKTGGMSTIGFLFYFTFITACIYFIVGSGFNYAVRGVRSFPELLPNHEIWVGLFHNTLDLFSSLMAKLRGRGGGYVSI